MYHSSLRLSTTRTQDLWKQDSRQSTSLRSSLVRLTSPIYLRVKLIRQSRLGNGVTNDFSQILSYYDMTCTPASVPPILDIPTCVAMKNTVRCFAIFSWFLWLTIYSTLAAKNGCKSPVLTLMTRSIVTLRPASAQKYSWVPTRALAWTLMI